MMCSNRLQIRVFSIGIAAMLLPIAALADTEGAAKKPAPEWVNDFADRLHEAWEKGEPMPQLSVHHPEAALAHGYAVQEAFIHRRLRPDDIGGYKAAVVGAGGQKNLGIDGPITGVVPASGVLEAGDSVVIDLADDPNRAVETELGYLFDDPVEEPLAGVAALKAHVKSVAGIVELPGGATASEQPATAADLAAWNVNAKAIIVGPEHDPAAVDMDAVDITLERDGETINTAQGGDAAGGQWQTLLKTVNNLVGRGFTIQPGHVITNGALGNIVGAEPGVHEADFGPLGTIAFHVIDNDAN